MFEHQIIRKFFLLPNFLSTLEKREYLESYKMVTFGRHPFVRLVSTYKDKLIDGNFHDWQKMMNYDKKHPYSVKCSSLLVFFESNHGNSMPIYFNSNVTLCDVLIALLSLGAM